MGEVEVLDLIIEAELVIPLDGEMIGLLAELELDLSLVEVVELPVDDVLDLSFFKVSDPSYQKEEIQINLPSSHFFSSLKKREKKERERSNL